ncbi:MAG: TIGR03790 family protein [Gammaproteobacteria bacterium]|nr:TIGR03790 family protein [Gammaproteobacteria bacterium]
MKHRYLSLLLTIALTTFASRSHADPQIILPKHRLEARELAIIVNDADPLSREIAAYYQQQRNIPKENLIHISFNPNRSALSAAEFIPLKNQVDAAASLDIQAYLITWATPYRVDCMSITSAFALGFDRRWCSAEGCAITQPSAYFNSNSTAPFRDFAMRPTMALAAKDFADAKALIDRGIASDGSRPTGTAYLVSTSDKARNVRAVQFPQIETVFSPFLKTKIVHNDKIIGRKDVLFYFTGRVKVEGLGTLKFLPGAVGDHLTSTGGKLTDSSQMSALRWLEAGATGSYGTVVEPCAHPTKFPNPGLMMTHYVQGETLIEAYWKSVQMPGEGIFIGEPLAAPFDFKDVEVQPEQVVLKTWSLKPGLYKLITSPSLIGPYTTQPTGYRIGFPLDELRIPNTGATVYRLEPLTPTP